MASTRPKGSSARARRSGGLGLAYVSASVAENASRGYHPLSFLRLGIGPIDLRLGIPFMTKDTTRVSVEVNVLSALNLALLPLLCCKPTVEDAVLLYRRHGTLRGPGAYRWQGQALNRTIVLRSSAGRGIFRHELIYLAQALQLSAVTPYYRLSSVFPGTDRTLGHSSITWDVQFDWLYLLVNSVFLAAPYDKRWAEREAYTLD